MKLRLSIIVTALVLLCACQRDEEDIQVIDQVLKMYVHNSAGQDLLNNRIKDSYSSVSLLDLLGETALVPVSGFSLIKDSDTVTYLDYAAGAVRLKRDSIGPELKTYYSKFIIRYSKTVNSQTVTDDDTIEIDYKWTPSLFELSSLKYNNQLKFTKVSGQPNVVKIVK